MSGAESEQLVREFCDAFGRRDVAALRRYFTDDVVYHNIPLDPAVGIDATLAFIEAFFGGCEDMAVDMVNLAVAGDVVLTERVDTMRMGGAVLSLPVMGAFEVRDGKICAWRDYFDLGQVTRALGSEL